MICNLAGYIQEKRHIGRLLFKGFKSDLNQSENKQQTTLITIQASLAVTILIILKGQGGLSRYFEKCSPYMIQSIFHLGEAVAIPKNARTSHCTYIRDQKPQFRRQFTRGLNQEEMDTRRMSQKILISRQQVSNLHEIIMIQQKG